MVQGFALTVPSSTSGDTMSSLISLVDNYISTYSSLKVTFSTPITVGDSTIYNITFSDLTNTPKVTLSIEGDNFYFTIPSASVSSAIFPVPVNSTITEGYMALFTVTSKSTGSPISNIKIDYTGIRSTTMTAYTGSNGTILISQIEPQSKITINMPSYVLYTLDISDATSYSISLPSRSFVAPSGCLISFFLWPLVILYGVVTIPIMALYAILRGL